AKRKASRYDRGMSTAPALDREEYIEQVYFFRTFRERLAQNLAAQEILEHLHEEILATTRLPLAIQFLATELKHTGELAPGFTRLSHYFTPFHAYVISQAEKEGQRFPVATGSAGTLAPTIWPTWSSSAPSFMCRKSVRRTRTTSRPCRRSLARKRARLPAPTAAATRYSSSPPCNGNSTIRKCRAPGRATT